VINATIQALFDPHINLWGFRLVEAQHLVVKEAAWLLDLDELTLYYEGPSTDDEYQIREWIEHNVRELGIKHLFLDAMVEYDKDLHYPDLLNQIYAQLDEDG